MAVHMETKAPEMSVLCFLKDFYLFIFGLGGGGVEEEGRTRQ